MCENPPRMTRFRFRPLHGVFLVLVFIAAVLGADYVLEGRMGQARFERVGRGRTAMSASRWPGSIRARCASTAS